MFSARFEKSILLHRVAKWRRRLRLNRILIGKPEFKHTNDKVIITLYVYNRELLILNSKITNLKRKILAEYFYKLLIKNKFIFSEILSIKSILKKIDLLKNKLKKIPKKKIITNKNMYIKIKVYTGLNEIWDQFKNLLSNKRKVSIAKSLNRLEYSMERPNIYNLNKRLFIYKYINNIAIDKNSLDNMVTKCFSIIPKFKLTKLMHLKVLRDMIIRIRLYLRLNRIKFFNKSKFNLHIIPLKMHLENIYKKEVEFNIINLKSHNLDSNILMQIMAIKLRNKKNRVANIIRKVLVRIKLPLTRRLDYYNVIPKLGFKQNRLIKHLIKKNFYDVKPNIIFNPLNKKQTIKLKKVNIIESNFDKIDNILKLLYPIEYTLSKNSVSKNMNYILKRNIENTTLDVMENKLISGIRIEASGRLSKRITASKSVFRMKQKGTIRNMNSSYKKLSSVLVRGNFKSNLQFTTVSNKTRIGAFGIKGWISSI